MKILKLKSIVFSLMAIAMVTVFLSSCEKSSIANELNEELIFHNEVSQHLNQNSETLEARGDCSTWKFYGQCGMRRYCQVGNGGFWQYRNFCKEMKLEVEHL